MKQILYGTNINQKKASAFVTFFVRNTQPFLNYEGIPKSEQEKSFSAILMLNRYDMRLGFIGGMIDTINGKTESIAQAVQREALEEANINIFERKYQLKPICSHEFSIITHLSAIELDTFEELKEIQKSILNAPHYGSEITGSTIVYLTSFKGEKNLGLGQLLKASMASSVFEELICLILKENLMPEEELVGILEKSGYDSDLIITEGKTIDGI